MNRKIVIICTVLALLLLGGIGFGFYKLFFTPESEGEELVNSKGDAMMAIPSDAIMVYDFASFDLLAEFYDGRVSPLASFLKICPPDIKNEGAVVSVHYPSKNTIAPLLVVSVEAILPWALAFAAGAMILVAVHELIPECQQERHEQPYLATMGILLGFAAMTLLDVMLG